MNRLGNLAWAPYSASQWLRYKYCGNQSLPDVTTEITATGLLEMGVPLESRWFVRRIQ
jgi:hypothetical protein